METSNLLFFGSTCVDVMIRLPEKPGNIYLDSQRLAVGGCAYNAANIAGRAGADAIFVTPVGMRGLYGSLVLQKLKTLPFAHPIVLDEAENGCCYCFIDSAGERRFLSVHGAEYTFQPDWMRPYEGKRWRYAFISGMEAEEKTGESLVAWLERAPIDTLFYAPGRSAVRPPLPWLPRIFALHPILHLNAEEAMHMSGAGNPEAAAKTLYQKTGSPVIVTLGHEGAMLFDGSYFLCEPAFPVSYVADTIGAGDAHAGAVLLGLSRGLSWQSILHFAAKVSARVVETDGATLSDADLHDVLGAF